jgi:hypothetical protein
MRASRLRLAFGTLAAFGFGMPAAMPRFSRADMPALMT